MRAVGPWHRLPREVEDAPSLGTSQARLNGALSSLTQVKTSLLMAKGWTGWPGKLQSHTDHSPTLLSMAGLPFSFFF